MKIKLAETKDLESILEIYKESREFMKAHGNYSQWKDTYPTEDIVRDDINNKILHVVEENNYILGVFALISGEDPTYKVIEEGNWLSDDPYVTIHRLGTRKDKQGIGTFIINYVTSKYDNVRADTHRDNYPMHNLLVKFGFVRCGVIYVYNTERIAYHYLKK